MGAPSHAPRPLSELAAFVGGEIVGDAALAVCGVNGLSEASATELSFFANPKYRAQLDTSRAGAVLVPRQTPPLPGRTLVRVDQPYVAFARLSALFHPRPRFEPGARAGAHVHPEARVDATATVMAGATVEKGAQVAQRAVLFPGVYVGEGALVGPDTVLYPNVVVREGCQVGARCILHPGVVIGADGFGFAFDPQSEGGPEHVKVPQVGIVRIEDDVEIGACSCVDRAALGETVIGRGTKIDNLVQIAHNVKVGPLSLLCAQAGVSGSTELGTGVVLAGQVGVVGHIRVGDLAKVGAQSGVAHDVPDGAVMSGSPAVDHRDWLKTSAAMGQVPSLVKEVRQLRKRTEALEKALEKALAQAQEQNLEKEKTR